MAKRARTPKQTPGRGFTTRAVHAASAAEEVRQKPAAVPIYQTAPFVFDDMADFAAVSQSKISGGYLYSRWANPTVDALARTVAELERAEATACFGSGMAAIHATISSLAMAGDHIVAARQLYGGTFGLFNHILPRAGIGVTFVDVTDHDAVAAAFTPKTKALYCESIGNPTLEIADLDALGTIARANRAALVVDATFTPPYLLLPLEHGVDLSLHSATKFMSGHSDVTAGVVSGSAAKVSAARMLSLEYGPTLGALDAFLAVRGLQTLALRMDRICSNALTLARYLEGRKGVAGVRYPGLESHPQRDLAKRLLARGFGGMLVFDVGSAAAGRRLLERVTVAQPAASLGGTKTLVVHPRTVTHTQLSAAERKASGITDGLIRVSVGIEDPEDLIADFDAALGKGGSATSRGAGPSRRKR